ncbi:MAG: hypothetical protein GEU95_09445 [Rhizobiales bacterium]|nr:hypothetical protein [Hyphomicrobiales bacterium]
MATLARGRLFFFDRVTFSWTAVLAGVTAALVVQVMLTMLGLGIGLISIDTSTAANTLVGVSWASFLYWAISGIIAAFVGGWIAGVVSAPSTGTGHALAAWAVATLIVIGVSMLAAGNSASIASNVMGPSGYSVARYDRLTDRAPQQGTVGQAATAGKQDIEAARRAVAGSMLGSFIALLLGAIAAFFGGRMANREEREAETQVVGS